ncbi:MAG: hypothetical protein WDO56_15875 [Gammaproteobacteria bacterium]
MNTKQSKAILESLVQGVDPETGERVPQNTVLDKPTVIRALLAGVAALSWTAERAARKAGAPLNIGKTWSEEEKQKLIDEFQSGKPIADISHDHGRTIRAIESRLQLMGQITAEERTTKDRGSP